jgi:hypothetical protein
VIVIVVVVMLVPVLSGVIVRGPSRMMLVAHTSRMTGKGHRSTSTLTTCSRLQTLRDSQLTECTI